MNLGNVFAGGKQLVSMGAGPFFLWIAVGAFVMGLGVGAYPTFLVTRAIYQRQALKSEANLATFNATLAQSAAAGQAEARRQLQEAFDAQAKKDAAIDAAIAAGFVRLEGQLVTQNAQLRRAINAPIYDCLRIPYPADSLQLLSRPGGRAPAGNSADPGAGEAAGSLF